MPKSRISRPPLPSKENNVVICRLQDVSSKYEEIREQTKNTAVATMEQCRTSKSRTSCDSILYSNLWDVVVPATNLTVDELLSIKISTKEHWDHKGEIKKMMTYIDQLRAALRYIIHRCCTSIGNNEEKYQLELVKLRECMNRNLFMSGAKQSELLIECLRLKCKLKTAGLALTSKEENILIIGKKITSHLDNKLKELETRRRSLHSQNESNRRLIANLQEHQNRITVERDQKENYLKELRQERSIFIKDNGDLRGCARQLKRHLENTLAKVKDTEFVKNVAHEENKNLIRENTRTAIH